MRIVLPLTDEPVIAAGFRSLIEGSSNVLLDPISLDTEDLGERLREAGPDVVLIAWNQDLRLTVLAGLFGTPPHCPVLLVARDPSPELAYQAKEAATPDCSIRGVRAARFSPLWNGAAAKTPVLIVPRASTCAQPGQYACRRVKDSSFAFLRRD
jgi:hypothetical protein